MNTADPIRNEQAAKYDQAIESKTPGKASRNGEWERSLPIRSLFALMVGLTFFLTPKAHAGAGTPPLIEMTIALPGVRGRIDHMAVDLKGQRLFVAAFENNTVEVIDLREGKRVRSIWGLNGPQGVLYLPEFQKLFVTNSGDGSCRVFDAKSFDPLRTIEFSADADNLRYDPQVQEVYVGYGDGSLAALDAKTGDRLWEARLDGHPEAFQLQASGPKIFVNVPSAKKVAVIDREKRQVTAGWPLEDAKDNFPMALDETNHRLFIGCRNPKKVIIYDSKTGRPVGSIDIVGDVDDIFYDRTTKRLYASCGEGFLCVIQQIDPDHYSALARIPTAKGARTSLFVSEYRRLYLAVPHREGQPAQVRIYRVQPLDRGFGSIEPIWWKGSPNGFRLKDFRNDEVNVCLDRRGRMPLPQEKNQLPLLPAKISTIATYATDISFELSQYP